MIRETAQSGFMQKNSYYREESPSNGWDGTDGAVSSELGPVRAGWSLQLVLGEFLDAIDEAPTTGGRGESVGVSRTEPEVGDDVGLIDQQRGIFPVDHRHQLGYGEPDKP